MADIVNLRQARKAKVRTEKAKQADANRLHFGRSKAEKEISSAKQTRDKATLDGHKLERSIKSPPKEK